MQFSHSQLTTIYRNYLISSAKYFISKLEMILQVIDIHSQQKRNNIDYASHRELIIKSSDATCFLDPMPTSLVKAHIDMLLLTISNIVNESLNFCLFPTDMKQAPVKPVLKKPSLDSEIHKNYRIISNLQFLSKLIEWAVVSRITKHMTVSKLHEPLQAAYRAFSSTETALILYLDDD